MDKWTVHSTDRHRLSPEPPGGLDPRRNPMHYRNQLSSRVEFSLVLKFREELITRILR